MSRVVVDLDRGATVLDAVERIRANPEGDVALVVPAGAPFARSAVFIDVARRVAVPRHVEIVSTDERARTLATSVRVPAYASLAALERGELDATEKLERTRIAALAGLRRARGSGISRRRALAIAGSLALAALLVAAVAVPEATITVAPATAAVGPMEFELKAGPGSGGDITKSDLSATVTRKFGATSTGSRTEDVKATGAVRLQNKQTVDIRIPKGTRFLGAGSLAFQSTEERTLPRSIIIFPLTITVGTVDVPIEAAVAGPTGNVAAGTITGSTSPNDYSVTNPAPTAGGETKKIPVVRQEDYAAAQQRASGELQAAAEAQLATWRNAPPRVGTAVFPKVFAKLTSLTPAAEVVGKDLATFDLTVTGTASAFAYPANEPTLSALARLRTGVSPGYDIDTKTAKVDVTRSDATEAGVITWAIRASASQLARVDRDAIRRALAGRGAGEARATLDRLGLRLVGDVRTSPGWWPRFPVLDGRIAIVEVPAAPPP